MPRRRPPTAGRPPPTPSRPPAWPASCVALGDFVEASVAFWLDVEEGGRAQGVNVFRPPAARTDMGGAAENVTVWGSWELADDEALVIEVTPARGPLLERSPSATTGGRPSTTPTTSRSLNGHQAVLDDDGVFRAVVAGTRPGRGQLARHRRPPARGP